MLKTITRHVKDLLFIKQILYGFAGWVVVRNLDDIYVYAYLNDDNKNKYIIANTVVGKTIYDIFDSKAVRHYKSCGENALSADNIFISKKTYTTVGQEYDGLLYFCPYKDKQNNIIGVVNYKVEIDYLKRATNMLFKNNLDKNYELNYLYHNLIIYKDLFDEIRKIIDRLDTNNIIHNNNIVLIGHLKNHLNILLNNLKQVHSSLSVSL